VIAILGTADIHMTSIDTSITTQLGDADRPAQTAQERSLQVQAATVSSQQQSETDSQASALSSSSASSTDVNAMAAQMKQVVESFSSQRLSLNIDPTSKQAYMQVTDTQTGEVIQQIPTKEMRELHIRLQQNIGALLNKKA
jgi:flagellar protein FlaG